MKIKNTEDVALAAVTALLLEVSATPKSGNVDRDHQYLDMKYEHFIISSVSAYPVFKKAAVKGRNIGKLIFEAAERSNKFKFGGNTHFGSFLLLIPLVASWKCENANAIATRATKLIKNSSYKDSIFLLKAFEILNPRVLDAQIMDIKSKDIKKEIVNKKINLYKWMSLAPKYNLIAKELISEFRISLEGMNLILDFFNEKEDINEAIVLTYHTLLSKYLDPLVISKFGFESAEKIRKQAEEALIKYEIGNLNSLRDLDLMMIEKNINPGTIADLTTSSIFLALMEGLKF